MCQLLAPLCRWLRGARPMAEDIAFSVNECVSSVVEALEPMLVPKGVNLEVLLSARHDTVRGAREDFVEVIRGLLLTAEQSIRQARRAGIASLSTSNDGSGFVLVQCTDTGFGLPVGNAEQVFETLHGLNDTSLPACRDAVLRMGGSLSVSPRPGGGAIFTIRLPVADHQ